MGGRGGGGGTGLAARVAEVKAENEIRAAYRDLPKSRAGWVSIADIREHRLVRDRDRSEVDAALKGLVAKQRPGAHLIPEMSQGQLTPRIRAGGIRIAGETTHYVKLDDPSPWPIPKR